jgi:energy-coupling factor transporter transmembrane protein EcfT
LHKWKAKSIFRKKSETLLFTGLLYYALTLLLLFFLFVVLPFLDLRSNVIPDKISILYPVFILGSTIGIFLLYYRLDSKLHTVFMMILVIITTVTLCIGLYSFSSTFAENYPHLVPKPIEQHPLTLDPLASNTYGLIPDVSKVEIYTDSQCMLLSETWHPTAIDTMNPDLSVKNYNKGQQLFFLRYRPNNLIEFASYTIQDSTGWTSITNTTFWEAPYLDWQYHSN